MKKIALFILSALLLASCTGITQKQSKTSTGTNSTWTVQKDTLQETKKAAQPKKVEKKAQKMDSSFQKAPIADWNIVATMKTSMGDIKIKLFQTETPNTVNNFIGLAQDKYYDGIIFHRVIKWFMIQWGDPTGTGKGGKSIYGDKFSDEFNPKLTNIKYSISMANAGPDTNGSQFFINQNDNHNLDNKHSVFGQVIAGQDIVEKIASTKTATWDKPEKDIKILSIAIEKSNKWKLEAFTLDKAKAISTYKEIEKKQKEAKKDLMIKNWDTVSVHYTLTVDGKKKDSSLDRKQPIIFTLGKKMVIPWWEKGLISHKIWDKFKLKVLPEDAYGKETIKIEKAQVIQYVWTGVTLEKGKQLPAPDGTKIDILDADATTITIKNMHPLANKELFFDIEIIDIK